MSAYDIINIGAAPNDGEGDPLRTAFTKINDNFSALFSTAFSSTTAITVGTAEQVIFQAPVSSFSQAIFQIRSSDADSANSQGITISAQVNNAQTGVVWTGYGTTISGSALVTYNMDVFESNVRILTTALANTTLTHFTVSQVTFIGTDVPGLDIQLDGYADGYLMTTEDSLLLTTESE